MSGFFFQCKETASAFSNPELQGILRKNQIPEIEITGIDGNFCIASTAIDSALQFQSPHFC
ncbi:isochorismatase family protein [Diplocloster hominis]|uniref:isochorismatase family protein n=1 Tax=Diplocloster hominis TaxID=3079010 RepID=UPI003CCF4393